jgi:sugar (pentulose or hexulose) kinase
MYLGMDIGSTSLKAAVFESRRGRLLAQAGTRLVLATDASGKREQNPSAILGALRRVAGELRRQVGRRWVGIRGIGLAAQGGSSILVDRASGVPVTALFLWNDTRAMTHFHALAATHPANWWRAFSMRDEPGMGLARAQWLRESRPDLFTAGRLWVGAGEFAYFHLTGLWRQDACHALQSGCYNVRQNRLAGRALVEIGLGLDRVAPLREGHETHPLSRVGAELLNLPPGIPVAGPYNDHEAGYLSVRNASQRPLQASLGTAWVGNFILPPGFQGRSPFHLVIAAPDRDGRQVIMPLMTGNVTWDWALATFVDANPRRAWVRVQKILDEHLLAPTGLVALPWLNRPNSLDPARNGSAAFLGVGPATTGDDLLRAVALGMVLEFGRVFDPVVRSGAVDSLVLCGGASRSPRFQAMFRSLVTPLPVRQVVEADLMGTRGCLFAFNTLAAEAATRWVRGAGKLNVTEMADARALYLEAFRRVYGSVAAGAPYVLTRRGHS